MADPSETSHVVAHMEHVLHVYERLLDPKFPWSASTSVRVILNCEKREVVPANLGNLPS